jgi:hypothetical protein
LRLTCRTPPGVKAALFWFDTKGQLRQMPAEEHRAPGNEGRLHFPPNKKFAPLDDRPGTELVLLGGDANGPLKTTDVLTKLPLNQPLPELPPNLMVYMDRDGVYLAIDGQLVDGGPLQKRGIGEPIALPLTEVEQRLEALRLHLRDRYGFFAALAFQHAE